MVKKIIEISREKKKSSHYNPARRMSIEDRRVYRKLK
jgi:hypothetical protein